MKKFLILSLTCNCLFVITALSQPYYDLIQQARSCHDSMKYARSVNLYQQAFKLDNKNAVDLVGAACSAAMAGDKETSFQYLEMAFQRGYSNAGKLRKNPDLAVLHTDTRWETLSAKIQARSAEIEKGYDIPLQKELLAILPDDQGPRLEYDRIAAKPGDNTHALDSVATIMVHNDSINGIKVTKMLNQYGWIGSNKVGSEASGVVFLVIQHSSNLQLQMKYLPVMRDAVAAGTADAGDLALLEDRVAVRQGKRQTYGSQIYFNEKTGQSYVAPLDHPENVDHRRARARLEPMAAYVKRFDITWDAKAYAKQLPELDKLSHKW